jgi:hypothetical protein
MAEIRADLVGDSRSLVKSVTNVAQALEDVTDELQDTAKAGDKTEGSLEDNFRAIAKAAREADEATEKIGGGTVKATKVAGAATGEFKDEAKQNFGEVASSFSGDMASAADLVQGTLGGLAASIGGPLGLALGAASIALGAVIAQAQADAERAEELRLRAVEAVKSAFEEGVDVSAFITAADQVATRIQELEESKEGTDQRWFWEDDPSRLEEWADALHILGRETSEVGDVLEADTKTLKRYERATQDAKDAVEGQIDALMAKDDLGQGDLRAIQRLQDEAGAYDDILKNLRSEIDLRGEATESAKRQRDAGIDAALEAAAAEEAATQAAEDAAQRRQDLADSVTESATTMYDSIRDSAVEAATSEEGVFDLSRWLALVEESRVQADAYRANLALLKLTPEQWENYLALPEDVRANIAASYAVADEGTKASIVGALTDTGAEAGAGAAVGFDESFNPKGDVEVTATVDTKAVKTGLETITKGTHEAKVTAVPDPRTFAGVAASLAALTASRAVSITPATDTSAITRQLANYHPPTVYVPAVLVKPGTRQPI